MKTKLVAILIATLILVSFSNALPANGNPMGVSFVNCQISSSKAGWNTVGFPIEKRFNGNLIPTLPRVGKIKAFIIFVDFPNYPGTESIENYSKHFTETTSDYFNWVSYGAIDFDFKYTPEYLRLSKSAESYCPLKTFVKNDHRAPRAFPLKISLNDGTDGQDSGLDPRVSSSFTPCSNAKSC